MNKHSPSVLIKKEMLKIWNIQMKQTKNPNTQFEIQIREKGKSWKTNLWIVAHGDSGLFPSSGELFFFEIVLLRRSMWRWWRFDMKEVFREWEGSCERSCERVSKLFFFLGLLFLYAQAPAIRLWRWWRCGMKEAEEWCESFWGFSVFYRERLWLFGEVSLLGAFFFWHGVVWLAGVKHWFYASSGPNVFSYEKGNVIFFILKTTTFFKG